MMSRSEFINDTEYVLPSIVRTLLIYQVNVFIYKVHQVFTISIDNCTMM